MITVNGKFISWGMGNYGGIFPSFEIKATGFPVDNYHNIIDFNWEPEHGDREVLYLWYIMNYIKEKEPNAYNILILRYVPNARLDKELGEDFDHNEELLPLNSYTARLINFMGFDQVIGIEPHSEEFIRCYDRAVSVFPTMSAIATVANYAGVKAAALQKILPDIGSFKRYRNFLADEKVIIANKERKDGKIANIGLSAQAVSKTRHLLIIDDICSRGSTAYRTAQLLKDAGAQGKIFLLVAHLEECVATVTPSLLDSSAPIERIFVCSASLKHIDHPKVTYIDDLELPEYYYI